jgi:hypothetical protein
MTPRRLISYFRTFGGKYCLISQCGSLVQVDAGMTGWWVVGGGWWVVGGALYLVRTWPVCQTISMMTFCLCLISSTEYILRYGPRLFACRYRWPLTLLPSPLPVLIWEEITLNIKHKVSLSDEIKLDTKIIFFDSGSRFSIHLNPNSVGLHLKRRQHVSPKRRNNCIIVYNLITNKTIIRPKSRFTAGFF